MSETWAMLLTAVATVGIGGVLIASAVAVLEAVAKTRRKS